MARKDESLETIDRKDGRTLGATRSDRHWTTHSYTQYDLTWHRQDDVPNLACNADEWPLLRVQTGWPWQTPCLVSRFRCLSASSAQYSVFQMHARQATRSKGLEANENRPTRGYAVELTGCRDSRCSLRGLF